MKKAFFILVLITLPFITLLPSVPQTVRSEQSIEAGLQSVPILPQEELNEKSNVQIILNGEYSKFQSDYLSFDYPSDWRITPLQDGALLVSQDVYISYDENGYSIQESGSTINVQYTDTYFSDIREYFDKNDNNIYLKSNAKHLNYINLHNLPTVEYEINDNGLNYKTIQFIKDAKLFSLSYYFSYSTKTRDETHFNRLVETLEIK